MKVRRLFSLVLTFGGLALLVQGCAFTAGAAAGAAGAEALEEEGYELDSPIEEEDEDEDQR